MKTKSLWLIYYGLFTISVGGQINIDPAPGRSPGSGMNVIKNGHGTVSESPTLLLIKDDANVLYDHNVTTEKEKSLSRIYSELSLNSMNKTNFIREHNEENFNKTRQTSRNVCKTQLNDYVKNSDKILELDGNFSGQSITEYYKKYFKLLADIKLNVTHSIFDTRKGIVCGLVYKVSVTAEKAELRNFFIESVSQGKEKGSFIHNNLERDLPRDDVLKNYQPVKQVAQTAKILSENDRNNEEFCIANSWAKDRYENGNASTFWTLNDFCNTEDSIEFRLFFRLKEEKDTQKLVFLKKFIYATVKECRLYLKLSSGSIDYTYLPPYYTSCTVHFPSYNEQYFTQQTGLLIEMIRLNSPCDMGGYIKFWKMPKLCGKLEELSETERTYHFDTHKDTFFQIYKNPMFSLRYKSVDYCYNMSLTERSGSFYLQPIEDSIECFFKIHLPYGNQIDINLVTNNKSAININEQDSSYKILDLRQFQTQLKPSNNKNNSIWFIGDMTSYDYENCNGLLVWVHYYKIYKWFYCIHSTDIENKFKLRTSSNNVSIYIIQVHNHYNSATKAKPSFYFSYSSRIAPDIVSECAFGWIAVNQFCISIVEKLLTWYDSEQYCINNYGHLASIQSEEDQKIIDQLILYSPGYIDDAAYWIGGSDKNFEGDFHWSDSLPFLYSNWFTGWPQYSYYNKQPNDDGLSSQDCIEIRRYFRPPPNIQQTKINLLDSFMWNDRDCEAKNFFLCERPIFDRPSNQDWQNDCNKTLSLTKEQPKMSLWSPLFPRQYPDNTNCFTTITAPNGYRIVLEFEELVIESELGCSYDYLEITEPSSTQTDFNSNETNNNKKDFLFDTFFSANYKHLLGIYSNLYQPRSNLLILTPDYPRGNPLSHTIKLRENIPRRICGDWSSKLKLLRYVSNGSYLGVHFVSDYSHHFGGYKAKAYMENSLSECSDERLKAYNGSCYLFVSYPEIDWWTAQQVCKSIGAKLSSITSPDEYRFITSSIRNQIDYAPQLIYWLGGEFSKEQNFEWTDGLPMTFQGWLPGEDQVNYSIKDSICMGLRWKISPTPMLPSGLYWASEKCKQVGGYICKRSKVFSKNFKVKNETLRGVEGRLKSTGYPNTYPPNIDYWIHVIAPERHRIILQFQKINLEAQDECLYDYVSIQNFDTISKISLEPANKIITPEYLMVKDNYDTVHNFKEKTKLLRGNRSIQKARVHRTLQKTKNFINNIPKFLSFRKSFNKIQTKRKRNAELISSVNSNLKQHSGNFNTSLDLNNAQTFLPYVRWCGSHDTNMSKFDFVSSSNEIILNFHSDYSNTGFGFAATWNGIDISGCPFQTLTGLEGIISSPNYPHFLINDLDCTYVIQASYGRKVWLEILEFNMIEESSLTIDLGEGKFHPFINNEHINEGTFISYGSQIKIHLLTGQKPRGKGFSIKYRMVASVLMEKSIQLSLNTKGYLYNLNYPQLMPEDVNYVQHFIAPLGNIILLELYGVEFSQNGCSKSALLEVYDNYADTNGSLWHLCKYMDEITPSTNHKNESSRNYILHAPIYVTSFLNTLHVRQKTKQSRGALLNATIRIQQDSNYKTKLASGDDFVESCTPNPCQFNGKCITGIQFNRCECVGHYTGRFCGLTVCELEPCLFGICELTTDSFECHCQVGYTGITCDHKQRPCADNPCEGRGECFEKNDGYFCRCHAWWEGLRCERRMMHIPYRPLSERMLTEPFWLGLITVFVVLAIIGLVWCAKRHFPEKIEKLLAEEADRNRTSGGHHHHTSLREQLQFTTSSSQSTSITPGASRSILNRLGIRKTSILSLSSPNPPEGATARTFSLDDLLRSPPRRSPSPRKKRNNSTPMKKSGTEKKQILQHLVSPVLPNSESTTAMNELIQLSDSQLPIEVIRSEGDLKETSFTESLGSTIIHAIRPLNDPKLEKKVTFARLLNKVSAEMNTGSDDIGHRTSNSSALSLPAEIQFRASSLPQSPCTNDTRSPRTILPNQGSASLSNSELQLADIDLKYSINRSQHTKMASADSILAILRNFSTTISSVNTSSLFAISPSTTSASSPQDDINIADDESSSSSIFTTMSFSSGPPDSPVFYRQSAIEVPVLDALTVHKTTQNSNQLHPPTILLEIPSNGMNKCLSPIRELPTPIPSPALTPILQRLQRSNSPIPKKESINVSCSEDDDVQQYDRGKQQQEQRNEEHRRKEPLPEQCSQDEILLIRHENDEPKSDTSINIDTKHPNVQQKKLRPKDLIIPTLYVQEPSPTIDQIPVFIFPGSPPPQRASIDETSTMFPNRQQQKSCEIAKSDLRLLRKYDKPTSLDLPFPPPIITITSNNNELESDAELLSPTQNKLESSSGTTAPSGGINMCYLSPFTMCNRSDRTISESNLSSSGYSSMASPGPSRCGSNNPLYPNEMDESGTGFHGNGLSLHVSLLSRRQSSVLASCKENVSNGTTSNSSSRNNNFSVHKSDDESNFEGAVAESNDEGISTDHLEDKTDDKHLKNLTKLENISKDNRNSEMIQLQLPSIVIQSGGTDKAISPVSSRSESPLSEKNSLGCFSTYFYSKSDNPLPFTDSDGLYDFPSSDNKSTTSLQRRSSCKKRERKQSKPIPNPSLNIDITCKDLNQTGHISSKYCLHSNHYYGNTINNRKSPRKRNLQRQPISNSSSSSESLAASREITRLSPSRTRGNIVSPLIDKSMRKWEKVDLQKNFNSIQSISYKDSITRQRKTSQIRAIGNQIRFLYRIEKSLKSRDIAIQSNKTDFNSESNQRTLSPKVSSPILSTKNKNLLCRQKRLPNTIYNACAANWETEDLSVLEDSIYSD